MVRRAVPLDQVLGKLTRLDDQFRDVTVALTVLFNQTNRVLI